MENSFQSYEISQENLNMVFAQIIHFKSNEQVTQIQEALIEKDKLHFDHYFLCQICHDIVIQPQECAKCRNCFCKKCINVWIKRSQTCPLCRNQFQGQQLHWHLKNMLDQLQFNCKKCNSQEILQYEKFLLHQNYECPALKFKCPLVCDDNLSLLNTEIKNHISTCPNMMSVCKQCHTKVKVKDQQSHQCIKSLKTILYKRNQEIQKLKRALVYQEHKFAKCFEGHTLKKIVPEKDFVVECDLCHKINIEEDECIWTCIEGCDFDVCYTCIAFLE